MDEMTGKARLRDRLGRLGYAITLVTVVLAGFAAGAGISVLVEMIRRPPIVALKHGVTGTVRLPADLDNAARLRSIPASRESAHEQRR